MATLDDLHDRLSKLQDGLDELRELIERLATAGKSPATSDNDDPSALYLDEDAAADLAAEIADGLRETQDDCELLQEDAADAGLSLTPSPSDSHDRARFKENLLRLSGDLQDHHAAFRRARLQARQNLDAARLEERHQMLAAYAHPDESEEEEEDDDADDDDDDDDDVEREDEYDETTAPPVGAHRHHHTRAVRSRRKPLAPAPPPAKPLSKTHAAAADVTAALRQTHARIAGEVARSDFAAQTLAESSRALADLGDRYHGNGKGDLNSSLQSARTLVKGLLAAHKSDTWYLQMALYLLVGTIGWLLFRRLLYGPLWLLVLWPVRSLLGTAMWMGRTVGPGMGGGVGGGGVRRGGNLASGLSGSGSGVGGGGFSVSTTVVTSVVTANVPSVQATPGSEAQGNSGNGNGDSLVDEVGRIVDGQEGATGPEAGQQPADEQPNPDQPNPDQPNPMKRMWEEDKEAVKYEAQQKADRKKDEL